MYANAATMWHGSWSINNIVPAVLWRFEAVSLEAVIQLQWSVNPLIKASRTGYAPLTVRGSLARSHHRRCVAHHRALVCEEVVAEATCELEAEIVHKR